jgi:hypothetical protein
MTAHDDLTAPYLAADQIIAVDAATFASSLGPPDFNVSDDHPCTGKHAAPTARCPMRSRRRQSL